MNADSVETGSPYGTIETPVDVSDIEGSVRDDGSEHVTFASSSSSGRRNNSSKTTLIKYLRTLHDELRDLHKVIAGFDLHLYRDQLPAVVAFAEGLLGLNYRLEAVRGEINNEAYYQYLQQAPIWEVKGMVKETEEKKKRLEGFVAGMMCGNGKNRARELEEAASETRIREEKEESWEAWFRRKFWG